MTAATLRRHGGAVAIGLFFSAAVTARTVRRV